MANDFIVEYTEDNQRKRERVQIANFDGNIEQAQKKIEQLWYPAMPYVKDIKVTEIFGSGRVHRVALNDQKSTPAGDAAIIAKEMKRAGVTAASIDTNKPE